MLNSHIDEKGKKSATKGMTLDEMIAQVITFMWNFKMAGFKKNDKLF